MDVQEDKSFLQRSSFSCLSSDFNCFPAKVCFSCFPKCSLDEGGTPKMSIFVRLLPIVCSNGSFLYFKFSFVISKIYRLKIESDLQTFYHILNKPTYIMGGSDSTPVEVLPLINDDEWRLEVEYCGS